MFFVLLYLLQCTVLATPQTDALSSITLGHCQANNDAALCTERNCAAIVRCEQVGMQRNVVTELVVGTSPGSTLPGLLLSSQLGLLWGLKTLTINGTATTITGSIPTHIGALTFLQNITIGACPALTGTLPSEIVKLTALQSLAIVSCKGLFTKFSALTFLSNMTSLQRLVLSTNAIDGAIPAELSRLTFLKELDLSKNKLTAIPDNLSSLTALRILDLAGNGNLNRIPASLGSLSSLTFLDLSNNEFASIPRGLGNLNLLRYVDLSQNQLVALPPEIASWTRLTYLDVAGNRLTGSFPSLFGVFRSLIHLDLDKNYLNGTLPTQMGVWFRNIFFLQMGRNLLQGTLPTELGALTACRIFFVPNNMLNGSIPSEIGLMRNLTRLRLAGNLLTGTIPAQLAELPRMELLDLRQNKLSGIIPSSLGRLSLLREFGVSSNLLSGTIPDKLFSQWPDLRILDLANNRLSGTIPTTLGILAKTCVQLDLDSNQLTGTIPSAVGSLTLLNILSAGHNLLTGPIPTEIGLLSRLISLVLRSNQLSGPLPTELGSLNPNLFVFLDLSNNSLSGPIPTEIGKLRTLGLMGLNVNKFTAIPTEIGLLTSLSGVLLENNLITGTMPVELANLHELTYVRISNNFLTGTIPNFGPSWPKLVYFEFSRNRLTGGTFEYFDSIIALRGSGNNFTSLDIKCNSRDPSVEQFRLIDFSNNNIEQMPDFVFESPNVCRVLSVVLNSNRIGPTTFRQMNFATQLLDLSYNFLEMDSDTLRWFTPVPSKCFCQYIPDLHVPSPLQRVLNFAANRIVYNNLILIELMGFPNLRNFTFDLCPKSERPPNFVCDPSFAPVDAVVDFNIEPQDFDDCKAKTHECQHYCADGWYPVLDYTCSCAVGYKLDPDHPRRCKPICGDGILSPEEECDFVYSPNGCRAVGVFECAVVDGYTCETRVIPPDPNDTLALPTAAGGCSATCGNGLLSPPEECDDGNRNNGDGCSASCMIEPGYHCPRPKEPCQLCYSDFMPVPVRESFFLFPRFRALGYRLDGMPFTACTDCGGGEAFQQRQVLKVPSCFAIPEFQHGPCSFACSNLTVFASAAESLYTVQKEFASGDFLNKVLGHHFGIAAQMRLVGNKRSAMDVSGEFVSEQAITGQPTSLVLEDSNRLSFDLSNCVNGTIQSNHSLRGSGNLSGQVSAAQVKDAIIALVTDVVPNIPSLQGTVEGCTIALVSTDPVALSSSNVTGIVVGVVCAFAALLLLLAASLLAYYYMRSDLHQLPEGIRWSYIHKVTHPWAWSYNGSKSTGYYERQYAAGSAEWQRVETLLVQQLHCKMAPTDIYAVYNPSLTSSFINHWHVTLSRYRSSHDQFFHDTYGKNERKLAVMEHYEQLVRRFEWNQGNKQTEDVPLLAALHGTDYHIAEKIAQTGFAALSSLDAGFFGKGIYFTSHFSYCLPYCFMKRSPAVLLAYCNLGHVFPVTEDHKDKEKSLVGAALKSGYSSHYVITTKHGNCFDPTKDDMTRSCDEIVIGQESQILPAFIIALNVDTAQHQLDKWNRELPSEKCVTQVPHSVLLESAVNGDDLHVQLSELSRETRSNLKERRISLDDSGRAGQNIQLLGTNSNIYSAATERGANPLNVDSETNERYFLL